MLIKYHLHVFFFYSWWAKIICKKGSCCLKHLRKMSFVKGIPELPLDQILTLKTFIHKESLPCSKKCVSEAFPGLRDFMEKLDKQWPNL